MILIFIGGALGTISRFGLSELIDSYRIATWLVNLIGTFIFVILYITYNQGDITDTAFSFWGMGFAGAFTTFSTVNNQLFESIIQKNYKIAFLTSLATYLIIFIFALIFYFLLVYIYY